MDSGSQQDPIEIEVQRRFRVKLAQYQSKVKVIVDLLVLERNELRAKTSELESKIQAYETTAERGDDEVSASDAKIKSNVLIEEMRTQLAEALDERDQLRDQIDSLTMENATLKEKTVYQQNIIDILNNPPPTTVNNSAHLSPSNSASFSSPKEYRKTSWIFKKTPTKEPLQRSASQPQHNNDLNKSTANLTSTMKAGTSPSQTEQRTLITSPSASSPRRTILAKSIDFEDEEEPEDDPDIIFGPPAEGAPPHSSCDIKRATLPKLIERLSSHKTVDTDFVSAFLLTYRSFTTSEVFFRMLCQRYLIAPPENASESEMEKFSAKKNIIRLRVGNVMKLWIEKYYFDFEENPDLLKMVSDFLENTLALDFEALSLNIRKLLTNTRSATITDIPLHLEDAPTPISPRGLTLMEFDPIEVARQLTLIEHGLFRAIRPQECLNQNWSKKEKDVVARGIVSVIKRFNLVSNWVATEIVQADKLRERAGVVKHFIKIAFECKTLNNFNAVLEILAGLQYTAIFRLKRTWEKIEGTKYKDMFEDLKELMASDDNYKSYRAKLKNVPHPCLPYLGVYLTDLTFIGDGNPDYLLNRPDMINFDKRQRTALIINEIKTYQQTPYNLQEERTIREYLLNIGGLPDKALLKHSLICEPKGTSSASSFTNKSLFKRFKFEL